MQIQINTKDVKIQDVTEGMFVKSFNLETSNIRYNEVLATHLPVIEKNRQMKVTFSNGSSVVNSVDHPICIRSGGVCEYKNSGELVVGDIGISESGEYVSVTNLVYARDLEEELADE